MNNLPEKANSKTLVGKFASRFGIEPEKLLTTLKATAFKLPSKNGEEQAVVTNEQMAALLVVADQYGLNPFTREIYAFPDRSKGIVPIVGVDGWARIVNENKSFDGVEFRYADDITQIDDDARECPIWIEAVFYRKDRTRPIIVREYLDECYRPAFKGKYGKSLGPWQSHTRRFLRHKAFIQGARLAFGFAGIYDDDEGARIVDVEPFMPPTPLDDTNEITKELLSHFAEEDEDGVVEFINHSANVNNSDVADLIRSALQNVEGFTKAFEYWNSRRSAETPPDPSKQSDEEPSADQAPKDEPEPEPDQAQSTKNNGGQLPLGASTNNSSGSGKKQGAGKGDGKAGK